MVLRIESKFLILQKSQTMSLLCFLGLIKGQHTPTIGASCKLGVAEVQIGGKNTQFFLKCEPNPE